jgi:hypothetical protein
MRNVRKAITAKRLMKKKTKTTAKPRLITFLITQRITKTKTMKAMVMKKSRPKKLFTTKDVQSLYIDQNYRSQNKCKNKMPIKIFLPMLEKTEMGT